MSSKGKQMSVIIAGATGSTGRNLVSRLVSHPDVSRVVALARHPIPVNRWTSVFPHLHSGDALRYLSVVPLDWVKVLADSANIPSSYVSDGVWRQEEEEVERLRFLNHMTHSSGLGTAGSGKTHGSAAAHRKRFLSGGISLNGNGSFHTAGGELHGASSSSSSGLWSSVSTVDSAVGVRPMGYVKFTPRGSITGRSEKGGDSLSTFSDAEKLQDSQAFLQQLLHNNFYNSVFSGHTVAINCLGTSHMLSTGSVLLVDYELSVAFAKMIRLFNCMAHADPTEDEERLLVEANSRELDSVLWGEIYSACYGKKPEASTQVASPGAPLSDQERKAIFPSTDESGMTSSSATPPWPSVDAGESKSEMRRMNRGNMATLKHYSQVSVRGANAASPIPYLRAHGLRDRDLLKIFNRRTRTFTSPGILHSLFLTTPTTHTVTMHGPDQAAVAGTAMPGSFSDDGLTATAGSVRFGASPMRVMKERARRREAVAATRAAERGTAENRSSVLAQLWYVCKHVWNGKARESDKSMNTVEEANRHHHYEMGTADAAAVKEALDRSPEAVARRRAQLLLRRDVVKIWENASVTIWRPGVFARPKPRFFEWVFSLFERPIDVRIFAECIVDDIMESIYKDSGFGHVGSVKIINGKSVARRTTMKAIEDGLNAEDTKVRKFR